MSGQNTRGGLPGQWRDARFDFAAPVRLVYGRGRIAELRDFAGGADRAILVTGRGSAAQSGLTGRIHAALKGMDIRVYDRVEPNPSVATVEEGARMAAGFRAGAVIGAGGGSAMDAAKAIATLAANPGTPFDAVISGKAVLRPPLHSVMIPTTCGTGSEANRYAIITDTTRNDKVNFSTASTYPSVGLLDPSVLDGAPRDIIAGTAFDAFTHALEGYISTRAQPFSDIIALDAMREILGAIEAGIAGDPDARGRLLYAASLAGIVIDHTGTTVLHAMGYYLTLRHGVPHGTANAALMPVLFAHMEKTNPARMAAVYSCFPVGIADHRAAADFIRRMGISTRLADHGMKAGELDDFVGYVMGKKNTASTPGPVTPDLLRGLVAGALNS